MQSLFRKDFERVRGEIVSSQADVSLLMQVRSSQAFPDMQKRIHTCIYADTRTCDALFKGLPIQWIKYLIMRIASCGMTLDV